MSYVIFGDSTIDLPQAMVDELEINVIPYIFTLDGKDYMNYLDYREISVKDFYSALRNGKTSTTTQVTAHRYLEAWKPFLEDGKDVLYMCLSSKLSKSYEQSILAAREAMEIYPQRTVITIDSKLASMGQGMLATYAARAKKEGKTLEENAKYLEEIIYKIHAWAMPDDLHHLKRGGRISSAKATIGTMLNVKPIIAILNDGKLEAVDKTRGRNKALTLLLEKMEKYEYRKDEAVYVIHGDAPELAEQLVEMIKEKFGIKDILVGEVGPIIGAHTGPGTIAVIFLGNIERIPNMNA
jgi:DegV family protein with EDD domain